MREVEVDGWLVGLWLVCFAVNIVEDDSRRSLNELARADTVICRERRRTSLHLKHSLFSHIGAKRVLHLDRSVGREGLVRRSERNERLGLDGLLRAARKRHVRHLDLVVTCSDALIGHASGAHKIILERVVCGAFALKVDEPFDAVRARR